MQIIKKFFGFNIPTFDSCDAIIWEPCSKSHAEIVPGYTSLLIDLGYRVTVFINPERIEERLFCRFTNPNLRLANPINYI